MNSKDSTVEVRWLGRIPYSTALELQEKLAASIARGTEAETLLLLEHEPVYTIGRTRDRSSLRDIDSLPFPMREINRGGKATYHGPGQLVGYPLLHLGQRGRDLHTYMRFLEGLLISVCAEFGVSAARRESLTGVWVGQKKIASLGVGLRRWISMHGFALNVDHDLSGFDAITPCGIAGVEMTSLSRESRIPIPLEKVASSVQRLFAESIESGPLRRQSTPE